MIIAFTVTLIAAAILLSIGLDNEASKTAEIGYYFLVIGTISIAIASVSYKNR